MGQPGEERIICVHEELFIRGWDRNKVAVPCTASLLPQVRSLMESGKSDAADALMTSEADRQLVAMGARQRWPLIPHPAFDLCIRHTGIPLQTEKQYRRQARPGDWRSAHFLVRKREGDGICVLVQGA